MRQTNGLTKQVGGRTVVSDVSFRCEPGTVTGILGPDGAGKTTTMRMLVDLSEPDSGHAQVLGGRYAALMTDVYPPFRLDMGAQETALDATRTDAIRPKPAADLS